METSRPKLRWYQYSLRSLFVFMTLVCIACGLYIGPKHRRHRAVVAIEEAEGTVSYVAAPDDEWWFKRTLRKFLPTDWFDEVRQIELVSRHKADEHVFAALEQFNELQEVFLDDTQITDAGLIHLKGLTRLRFLGMGHTGITDAGLIHLKGLSGLHLLCINDTRITDAGLFHLKGLTDLRSLSLESTQITDAGLLHLAGLNKLRHLYLDGTQITDAGKAELKETLPKCKMVSDSLNPRAPSQPSNASPPTPDHARPRPATQIRGLNKRQAATIIKCLDVWPLNVENPPALSHPYCVRRTDRVRR